MLPIKVAYRDPKTKVNNEVSIVTWSADLEHVILLYQGEFIKVARKDIRFARWDY